MPSTSIVVVVLGVLAVTGVVLVALLRRERRLARERATAALRAATGRVVHHSRNPLQSILLHADLLGDGNAAAGEARAEICHAIVSEAQRLSGMMSELAVFAGGVGDSPSRQLVPMRELLHEMARTGPTGAAEVTVEADVDGWVTADPYQIRSAMESILANAREAVARREEPRVVARVLERGRHVLVEVSDNGDGIPADRIGSACEPFVSWRAGRMGLGLANAREIVERHGGRIVLQSADGSGTTVRVILPGS